MNKKDKDKAVEISGHYLQIVDCFAKTHYDEDDILSTARDAAMEMAAWKEQQMIDRAKEFISTWFYEHPHTSWLICSDEFQDLDDCLERLEKEMKEEN